MKIYRMLLLGLSFPVLLFAAGPAPQPITIDSQSRVVAGQEVYRASARTFRLSFVDNGTATDITGYTPFMTWSTSNTASICYTSVASVVSATGGVADCAFSSAQLDYAAGAYIFEAGLVDDPIVFRQGVFRIRASPYGQGTGAAIATTNLNWAAIGNTGTESSPFALKTRTITIDGVSGMLTNSLTFSTAGSTNTPAVYLSVTNIADSAPHLTLTRTDAHTITVTETGFGTAADSNASAFVAAGDVALAAALTNVTGNAEIVVTGAGRTRMLSIAATIARDAEVIAATGALDEVAFDGEVDPVFAESVAVSITAAATQEWATAYGWGNHAMAGYAGTGDLADVVADVDVLQTGKAAVVHAHVWPDLTDGGTVSQNMANASDAASASRDAALSNAVVALYGAADTALSNNVLIAADTAAASRDTSLSNNFVAVVGGATNDAVADATNRVAGMGFLTAESDPLALLANGTRELAADLDVDGYNLRHVNTIYFTNSAWWHPYDYPLEPYFFWSTRNSAGPTWWPNDLYLVRPTPYAYHEETGIVWCAWNDGSGSGLDADALDGQHFLGVSNTMVGISAAATNALETEITWRGYLKTESDSLWVAWVTNAAAGSTNAILSDGTLIDVGALLGGTAGAITGGTITASNADSFDVADGAATLTYNTNVFAGTATATNVTLADLTDSMTSNSIPVGDGTDLVLKTPAEVRVILDIDASNALFATAFSAQGETNTAFSLAIDGKAATAHQHYNSADVAPGATDGYVLYSSGVTNEWGALPTTADWSADAAQASNLVGLAQNLDVNTHAVSNVTAIVFVGQLGTNLYAKHVWLAGTNYFGLWMDGGDTYLYPVGP